MTCTNENKDFLDVVFFSERVS